MLRSMFAAVSGLRSHQTMMDVVGNNVANVNTSGYKSSRTTFRETLTQAVRGGTGATAATQGGANPMQLGLGARVGATDGVFTQGATQVTGRVTDLAIQGDGFFVVSKGDPGDASSEQLYTRAGAFSFDAAGNLVGAGGELVMGWMGTGIDPSTYTPDPATLDVVQLDLSTYTDVTIGRDGVVRGRNGDSVETLGMLAIGRFANDGGLERVGDGLYAPGVNAGDALIGKAGTDGRGSLESGTLEMSNVDLAQEFTNLIIAQRGFQANARTITASDELLQDLVNLKR